MDSSIRLSRATWIASLVAGGAGLSLFFACATPFAALATLAALKTDRRDTAMVVGLIWLANQFIGYAFLGYPWTWDSAAWGIAIGASAGLAVLAASALSATRRTSLAISLPFVGAFAAYELGLYAAAFMLPSEAMAFSAGVVGHLFLINVVALVALMVIRQLANVVGRSAAERALPNGSAAGSLRA